MSTWTRVSMLTAIGVTFAIAAFSQAVGGADATTTATTAVKAAQQALKDKGHDPGSIDGVIGPKTEAAIRDFQTHEGLDVTGRLDGTTLARLGLSAMDESVSASPPTSRAAGARATTGDGPAAKPDPDAYQNK